MNRKKKLIFGVTLWLSVVILSGCVPTNTSSMTTVPSNTTYSGSIEEYRYDDSFYIYVDPDTGVNYIVYVGMKKGGITPRYNPNGSLFVTKN